MMEFSKIYIINDHPFPTAVYKLALDMYNSTSGRCNLIQLGDLHDVSENEKNTRTLKYVGENSGIVHKSLRYFNPKGSYEGLKETLEEIKEKGGLIHYSNQSIRPLRESNSDIVSVNDNPISVTKTDLYSLSPARRLLTSRHYSKYSKYKHVIANSNYTKRSLEEFGFLGEITVIPPAVNKGITKLDKGPSLRSKLGLPNDKKLILSVTNGIKRKNLDYVERVMKRLGSNFQLVRIGNRVGNSITFENLPAAKVNEIYNACDLLFFPSLEEGFGIPVAEAFEVGIPAVVSDIEVMHEVASESAIYVDPKNVDDGVRGIKEAFANPEPLIQSGQNRAKMFGFDSFREKMLSFYSELG